jgi:hypothetical protein
MFYVNYPSKIMHTQKKKTSILDLNLQKLIFKYKQLRHKHKKKTNKQANQEQFTN